MKFQLALKNTHTGQIETFVADENGIVSLPNRYYDVSVEAIR